MSKETCWSDKNNSLVLHDLHQYIIGTAKPYSDSKGNHGSADRLVATQPFKFGSRYNIRKLMELPCHLAVTGMAGLKTHVLCNLEWLVAKLVATSFRYITIYIYLCFIDNYFPNLEIHNMTHIQ